VSQLEVLILKLVAVDRLSSSAVALSEVTPLTHEAWDDAVELAALEPEPFLSGTQGTEVLTCLWYNV